MTSFTEALKQAGLTTSPAPSSSFSDMLASAGLTTQPALDAAPPPTDFPMPGQEGYVPDDAPKWMGQVPTSDQMILDGLQQQYLEIGEGNEGYKEAVDQYQIEKAIFDAKASDYQQAHQEFLKEGITPEEQHRRDLAARAIGGNAIPSSLRSAAVGVGRAAFTPVSAFIRASGDQDLADFINRGFDKQAEFSQAALADSPEAKLLSWAAGKKTGEWIAGLSGSTIESLAQGYTYSLAGGYPAVIAGFSFEAGDDAYTEAIDRGLSQSEATSYALQQGAIEGTITALFGKAGNTVARQIGSGAGKVLGRTSRELSKEGKSGIASFIRGLFAEVGEENAISAISQVNGQLHGVKDDLTVEQWGRMVLDTTLQAGMSKGVASAVDSVGNAVADPKKPDPGRRLFGPDPLANQPEAPGQMSITKDGLVEREAAGGPEAAPEGDTRPETPADPPTQQEASQEPTEDVAPEPAAPTPPTEGEIARDGGLDTQQTGGERLDAATFEEKIRSTATTPEEADAVLAITAARASAIGEDLGSYVGRRIADVKRAPLADSAYLKQQDGKRKLGGALAQAAWHGSPYKFDKFTTDHIGSGEGAQAYGWGLYFAGDESVADYYKRQRASNTLIPRELLAEYFKPGSEVPSYGGKDTVVAFHPREDGRWFVEVRGEDGRIRTHSTHPSWAAYNEATGNESIPTKYRVDLKPDDNRLLDYDKKLPEMPEGVQRLVANALGDLATRDGMNPDRWTGRSIYRIVTDAIAEGDLAADVPPDSDLGRAIQAGEAEKAASLYLESHGIAGIKYLDGGSRSSGEGSHNFVIFHDADVAIQEVLAQKGKTSIRGEAEPLADGRYIIRAFEGNQKVSTLAHELGHVFRQDLPEADMKIAADWAGAKNGKWTRKAEEKFARGFERYLSKGRAPTKELKPVFEKFKQWMLDVYKAIKGSPIDIRISREMQAVFDRMLSPQVVKTTEVKPSEEAAAALAQEEAEFTFRFRDLANTSLDPTIREANYEVDEILGTPDRRKRIVAAKEAQQRLLKDSGAELGAMLERINSADKEGATINLSNEADTVVMRKLINMTARAGISGNDKAARMTHRKLLRAYRQARSEQARSLSLQDPLGVDGAVRTVEEQREDALTGALSTEPAEIAEKRKKAKDAKELAALDEAAEKRYGELVDELRKHGFDPSKLSEIAKDPKQSIKMLELIRSRTNDKPWYKDADVYYEYWRNSILSGPRTHVVNIAGNTAFTAWRMGPERAAEAFVNLFAGEKSQASFGEFRYIAQGLFSSQSWQNALQNAWVSFTTETDAFSESLGRVGKFKYDSNGHAIQGWAGKIIRLPFRSLAAFDSLAKTMSSQMEIGAQAYRIAKAEGLEGEAASARMQELIDDHGSLAWDAAIESAQEMAFQGGNPGVVAEGFGKFADKVRSFKGGRWVVPFRDTPAAIFEEGLKRTPVLGAVLDYRTARRRGENMSITPTVARQFISMMAMAALMSLNDDEEPWITGAEAVLDYKNDASTAFRGAPGPPLSIRVGDTWYSYARLEPFATALGLMVDGSSAIKRGDSVGGVLSQLAKSHARQVSSKTFMDGVGDVIDVGQNLLSGAENPRGKSIDEWGSDFVASWVPNIYRQIAKNADGFVPQSDFDHNRLMSTEDYLGQVFRRTGQQAGVLPRYPKVDVWGNEARYSDIDVSKPSGFISSLFNPLSPKEAGARAADRALFMWNLKNPEDKKSFAPPQDWFRATPPGENKEKTFYLTDQEYEEYAKLSGEMASRIVDQATFHIDEPRKQELEWASGKISQARSAAKKQLLRKWLEDRGLIKEQPTPTRSPAPPGGRRFGG